MKGQKSAGKGGTDLAPKRRVERVSSMFHIDGEHAISSVVFEFPPSESWESVS